MVFSRLSAQEKEAFFGLLDEYFASRPQILGSVSPAAAASVVGHIAGRSNNPFTANTSSGVDVGRIASLAGAVHARSQSHSPAGSGSEVEKLVAQKTSVFSALKKGSGAAAAAAPGSVAVPVAFGAPRNTYGPPPVRRVALEKEKETSEGEWAEVLYDYSSEDPGDLTIEAGTRVLVTNRSLEDWWTGRIQGQGKEGLFPASYVKLL